MDSLLRKFLAATRQVAPSVPANLDLNRRLSGLSRSTSLFQEGIRFSGQTDAPVTLSEQLAGTAPLTTNSRDASEALRTVVVTGAAGNLGHKVANHLLTGKSSPGKFRLVLMDSAPCPPELNLQNNPNGHEVEFIQCDFSKYDPSWVSKFQSCYAAFLFAARHPLPDASSLDAYIAMMINAHTLEACVRGQTKRVIFASSNHVVGGLLQEQKKIAPNAKPNFGTKYNLKGFWMDSTLYASAKVAGEAQIQAMIASGRLSQAIILRIGFCQPGDNPKGTLPLTGNPKQEIDSGKQAASRAEQETEKKVANWWKGMYLKNEDLQQLVDRCLADRVQEGPKLIYVNGVSRNSESRWIIDNNDIGYEPSVAS